jgi:hypothetical protein
LIDPRARIDETAFIGHGVIMPAKVTVEGAVVVDAGVVFAAGGANHTIARAGCCIGAGAVIDAGVELGRGCEVRPGTVVFRSVPPNAIVEGNPAVIVGYTTGIRGTASPAIDSGSLQRADDQQLSGNSQSLGVGGASIYGMKRIADLRGSLTAGEMDKELPFAPRRYFIVYDVPSSELRGEHAHRECHQFLIAVRGSCRILLDDGSSRAEVTLDSPDVGVYMPPMIWGTQYRYTRDAALLVFASHIYNPADYIRTYDEFVQAIEEGQS